jgi:hypothetical protein
LRERNPWDSRPAVDWDATLAFRSQLWDQGLHLAEAMDTAQRGMGVDWPTALELIQRTMRAARAHPMHPRVACGAGTDHKAPQDLTTPDTILAAYSDQAEAIEAAGGQLILMASRAFTALNATPETYHQVYRRLIDQAAQPVILHWLGAMFDPALSRLLGHHGRRRKPPTSSSPSSPRTPPKWTASRSPSWTRPMKRPSAPACPPASGFIPATISTMRR